MTKIKIIIADDQVLMRDGLKTILDLEEDLEVIYTTGNGREAYKITGELLPDVVLLDVQMPKMDGVECVKLIKRDFPLVKVLMLTTFNQEEYIINALANGADGFLLKDMRGERLIEAVRQGAGGDLILPAKVAGKLASSLSKVLTVEEMRNEIAYRELDKVHFSNREKEIAALMVKGRNNRQIAEYLNLTEGTVKNYITVIYEKLGTNDRNMAVSYLKKYFKIRKNQD
ncbi:MAG: response regulator transcription factor [Firmicutes bacterium]|nr:response regulator transcription factor [Bacillota bacterium]